MIESLLLQVMPINTFITHRLATASTSTIAYGINASGHIVGAYSRSSGSYGFLYSGGTYTTLDVIGIETTAFGINASGHIVGSYIEKTVHGLKRHGFFYINGLYATFDHPSSTYWTSPPGINAAGYIVGGGEGNGFLYINGLYATIHHPSAPSNLATGINDKGQIVGAYFKKDRVASYLLTGGTYATIDYPSATDTVAQGINNNGQIVGTYIDSSGSFSRGFLYNPNGGTYTTLNFPWPIKNSLATGINDNGQIVGSYSNDSGDHGFLYNPTNGGTYTTLDAP